ncbi:hypothetical protein FisN_28Hh037 [Fistulifera solaris]|uniref:Uncharacterized protein n=1 Tax=Fistulifera solaris TaxID=1519565 RepID=A0A1Z5KHZ8_FISSO|nr:hypothetical protein FisN_28Hh037 [Fistulifera solaris]|eukprot:GAX25568.1 hypothetical protein FisN_28Hh037 [Fistulifera solaris]
MIFCGAPIDQQVIQEEYTAPTKNLLPDLCVKIDTEDQIIEEIIPVVTVVEPTLPVDPPSSAAPAPVNLCDEEPQMRSQHSKIFKHDALSKALDKIDETIAVDSASSKQEAKVSPKRSPQKSFITHVTAPRIPPPRRVSSPYRVQQRSRPTLTTPPPTRTNKVSKAPVRAKATNRSSSRTPNATSNELSAHNIDEPLEKLIERLEDGFRVTLQSGPSIRELGGMNLLFFLSQDRQRIMVESFMYVDENRQDQDSSIAIRIRDIVKIEVRDGRRGKNCFFVHALRERESVRCYEFEASSKWEREVIISALLVILDQVNAEQELREIEESKTRKFVTKVYEKEEENVVVGTKSKPIVCNPSLEEEEIAVLSPVTQTRLFDSDRGTEVSLFVLSDVQSQCSRRTIRSALSQGIPLPECVEIPGPNCLGSKKTDSEEIGEEKKATTDQAPSQEITACNSHSLLVASGNWCTDDICSNALRDIAETCAGIFGRKQHVASGPLSTGLSCQVDQQLALEEYIATALDAPNTMYSYLVEGDNGNAEATNNQSEQATPLGQVRRRVQNRANLLNAQAIRLRNLRNEMTFTSAFKRSKEMKLPPRAQSFDDAQIYSSQRRQQQATLKGAEKLHASPLIQNIVQALALDEPQNTSNEGEEVAYYDSDPEDMEPREPSDRGLVYFDRIDRARQILSKSDSPFKARGLDKIPLGKKVKKLDEASVVEIVQTMLNERIMLMWHPEVSKSKPGGAPICVKAWIESGVYLVDGTFLLPKFTMIRATDASSLSNEKIPLKQSASLEKFDLLDVCRIFVPEMIDRSSYPYPHMSRSFIIETGTSHFMLEAQSVEDRDRIVYGLKLVIARLASLLMLRDMRAASEFFGATAHMVPGEAPRWTQDSCRDLWDTSKSTAEASSAIQ